MSEQSVMEVEADVLDGSMPCRTSAKWVAVVDDVLIPMPGQVVPVSLLATQASVPEGSVLVRDHNSPNDYVLPEQGKIDLAEGNVFYRVERCDVQQRGDCRDKPKLAFVMDDKFEIVVRSDQTGRSIRELFGLPAHTKVFRDTEGPNDIEVASGTGVGFVDGPVFYSRHVQSALKITVNHRIFTEHNGVKSEMTGLEIAGLVYPENPSNTRVHMLSEGNREIALTDKVRIKGCEEFEVVRKEVTGGFEGPRLAREIDNLREGGLSVTLDEKSGAVVYHNLPTGPNAPIQVTDVLVPIPGAYPGQMIDWAYLPEGSPLIGRVKGSPQEHRITSLGRVWQQISYHPHNGGGGPPWNPPLHGFHTYFGEVLSWLKNI